MPLFIVRDNICRMEADAIVCATDPILSGSGGVDADIHEAAGPELDAACRALGGCPVGQARITEGFRLPCRYVIHTAGPIWEGGSHNEEQLLRSCYRSALELAKEKECESVALPLISAGSFGYPRDQALQTAMDSIGGFLLENDMDVYLVVYGREEVQLSKRLFTEIREYIDDHYVQARRKSTGCRQSEVYHLQHGAQAAAREENAFAAPAAPLRRESELDFDGADTAASLDDLVRDLDESFQQMVLRKIDEKGISDAACYKRANMDRKHFSKLRGDVHYHPGKRTAVALAIALELDLEETRELLMKAGFALSHSNVADVIVEYFIRSGNYNIMELNEALFAFDQVPLN